MRSKLLCYAGLAVALTAVSIHAETHYVDRFNPTPRPPFTSWAFAANDIQSAVDVATNGETVLVSNGVYDVGTRITPDRTLRNRVVVTNAISIQSVNGPGATIIAGAPDPNTGGHGPEAVRCVYLAPGASLAGFTLTNGYTEATGTSAYNLSGGGALLSFGGTVSNCIIRGNRASYYGAGVYCREGGLVIDTLIEGNEADDTGAGAFCFAGGEFRRCRIAGNIATNLTTGGAGYGGAGYVHQVGLYAECVIEANQGLWGGGPLLNGGAMVDCIVRSNRAAQYGGGMYIWAAGSASNCEVEANVAGAWGGGALLYGGGLLANCTFSNNDAASYGGGAVAYQGGSIRSCHFVTNHSGYEGGGAYLSSAPGEAVSDCLFERNRADSNGGGAFIAFGGTIVDSTFVSNASYSGAGIYVENSGQVTRSLLQGNTAAFNGGGVYFNQGGSVSRCTLRGNTASQGGGVYTLNGGVLDNSLLVDNSAQQGGGCAGVDWLSTTGLVVHCTIVSNAATDQGGGAFESSLRNCIVVGNSAGTGSPNWKDGTLAACCTTPMPTGSVDSITDAPLFIGADAADFRPSYGSPVIDAADNAYAVGVADLGGLARLVGATVDMGAYEYDGDRYDSDGDIIADSWEARYGLNPTNGADGAVQSDNDGVSNWEEYIADTNPTNGASYFHVADAGHTNSFAVVVACSTARVYGLELAADVVAGAWNGVAGATGIPGDPSGTLTLTDPGDWERATYRVVVSLP